MEENKGNEVNTAQKKVSVKTETVGDRVKVIRIALKMSQIEMAKRLGVTQPTISAIEHGTRPLTHSLLLLLVKEGFSADWIMNGMGEGNPLEKVPVQPPVYTEGDAVKEKMIVSIIETMKSLDCMQLASVKGYAEGLKQQKELEKVILK